MKTILVKTKSKYYKIYIGYNIIANINNIIKKENIKFKKSLVIFDKNISKFFIKKLKNKISSEKNIFLSFEASEKNKNLKNVNSILQVLLRNNFSRGDVIICIGGGIAGDVSGFVASIFKRGINFINLPSTLLAQVDSAIGGKTGVNSIHGKNLIGSFYQPKLVISDTSLINSLPKKEMICGYAEILKHSIIKDKKFFNWLEKNSKFIFDLQPKILLEAIYKSIIIKRKFVLKDEKEKLRNKYSRAILNFGHTFGHALETFYNYNKKLTHGEAISIGMTISAKISYKLNYLSYQNYEKIISHLNNNNLPTFDKNMYNKNIFLNIKKDKKNLNGVINFVLINKIGNAFLINNLNLKNIKKIIK